MNRLAPYTIPYLKTYKNGNQKLVKVKTIKWFTEPMYTVPITKSGTYQPITYTIFNPGSRAHIKLWMEYDLGYKFPYYTPKGGVKVDVESLENMEHKEGKLLKRYLKVVKDQSQLGGADGSIIKNYNETTCTVKSRVNTNGTITGRFTSSSINLAQIPAQQEFRELFSAPTYYYIDKELYNECKKFI
jgi:hypothetical protein